MRAFPIRVNWIHIGLDIMSNDQLVYWFETMALRLDNDWQQRWNFVLSLKGCFILIFYYCIFWSECVVSSEKLYLIVFMTCRKISNLFLEMSVKLVTWTSVIPRTWHGKIHVRIWLGMCVCVYFTTKFHAHFKCG